MPGHETDKPVPRIGVSKIRLRGAAVALPTAAVLLIALWLTPRSSGYGTHEQLGLPPCTAMALGEPCPACGMTTSVSNMAHGRPAEAFEAHPFGIIFFIAVLVSFVAGTIELIFGRSVFHKLKPRAWRSTAAGVILLAGVGWKLAVLN